MGVQYRQRVLRTVQTQAKWFAARGALAEQCAPTTTLALKTWKIMKETDDRLSRKHCRSYKTMSFFQVESFCTYHMILQLVTKCQCIVDIEALQTHLLTLMFVSNNLHLQISRIQQWTTLIYALAYKETSWIVAHNFSTLLLRYTLCLSFTERAWTFTKIGLLPYNVAAQVKGKRCG